MDRMMMTTSEDRCFGIARFFFVLGIVAVRSLMGLGTRREMSAEVCKRPCKVYTG